MTLSVIIKTELGRSGRLSLARGATGVEFTDARKAEAEASRMRFRDDRANYCVYTGIFHTHQEAATYVQLRNQGLPTEKAMKAVRANRVDVRI